MRRIAAISFLSFLMVGAAEREPQLPRMSGETIEVSLVNLDVVVTDRNGQRVHGLMAKDFELLEDGKPQAITNFSAYRSENAAPDSARPADVAEPGSRAEARPAFQRRTVVVFVDQLRLAPFKRDPVFNALKDLLHEVVRKGDAVSILSWRGEPVAALDPTDDLAAVDATLDGLAKQTTGVQGDPLNDFRRSVTQNMDFYRRSVELARQRGYNVDVNSFVPPLDAYEAAVWAKAEMKRKTQALQAIMTGFAGTEGRKVLLLASHRLSQTAGAEFFFAAGRSLPLNQQLRAEFNTAGLVRSIARTANATGFTVYPLYPEGMGSTFTLPDAQQQQNIHALDISGVTGGSSAGFDNEVYSNEAISLNDIAEQTGGVMAGSAKDIAELLPRVAEDFADYYSLAYRATRHGEDRARSVVVRARNHDYTVRSRRAIVEKSERTRMQERVVATLFAQPERSAIPLRVEIGTAKKAGPNRYRIPLTIHIPTSRLMTVAEQRGAIGGFSVYLAWGGILGEISDVTTRVQPFTARDFKDGKGYFTYDFEMMADDRTDRVAVGVLDELGKDFGVARVALPPRG
ncbi:MAG TPA: VWA domain-containing protein [Thermoanaerobaculia bacterium]|jgi:VWFA-related protein|nr:VWA domain-containing protein [Thermoanaerobaculia bacterium]